MGTRLSEGGVVFPSEVVDGILTIQFAPGIQIKEDISKFTKKSYTRQAIWEHSNIATLLYTEDYSHMLIIWFTGGIGIFRRTADNGYLLKSRRNFEFTEFVDKYFTRTIIGLLQSKPQIQSQHNALTQLHTLTFKEGYYPTTIIIDAQDDKSGYVFDVKDNQLYVESIMYGGEKYPTYVRVAGGLRLFKSDIEYSISNAYEIPQITGSAWTVDI